MSETRPADGRADVIVIGFGAAGMAAAITAHDAGADVIIVEKTPPEEAGGNTRVSGSVWFSPTDVEAAKTYLRALSGEYPVAEETVAVWAEETAKTTEWLVARGTEVLGRVERDPGDPYGQGVDVTHTTYGAEMGTLWDTGIPDEEFPELEGSAACDSGYNYFGPSQGFSRVWLTLKACIEDRGIPVLFQHRAVDLLRDGQGVVSGVEVDTPDGRRTLDARRGVVLASGGFEANQEMVRTYLRLPYSTPWGSPHNTGDGIKIAMRAGADLANMHNHMPHPGLHLEGEDTGDHANVLDHRFVLVGADGRRFMNDDETSRHGKLIQRGRFEFYPAMPMYTIFDEDGRLAGPIVWSQAEFASGWRKQVRRQEWSADNSAEVEKGWIVKGETLTELAEKLGIDPAGLKAEIATYNESCRAGQDEAFGRPANTLVPIERPPFYGYRWGGLLITTLGGPRKDHHARVIDTEGRPIPRLYCAGEISSTYTWCMSGGQMISDALAFGRIAARNVVAEVPRDADAALETSHA